MKRRSADVDRRLRGVRKVFPGHFRLAKQPAVDQFNTLHHRVIHIADLVFPRTEASPAVDLVIHQVGLNCRKRLIAVKGGHGVAVVHVDQVGAGNPIEVTRFNQVRVEQPFESRDRRSWLYFPACGRCSSSHLRAEMIVIRGDVRGVVRQVRDAIERAGRLREV